jgi:POLQ-like helicase
MKLETRSKTVLAITKSKAKMYEFGIDESYHIDLPSDPNKLLITTIGILGDLAAMQSRQIDEHERVFEDLKSELISVGQYFDSLIGSHLADEIADYLNVVGSAAYYLAGMPGSSMVLAKGLPYDPEDLTPSYLEGLLIWLLKSDFSQDWYRREDDHLTQYIDRLAGACRDYFNLNSVGAVPRAAAEELRKIVYETGNDRELLFVDVIVAVIIRKIENSSINCLPKYTALPITEWLPVLQKPGFIQEFWPAQKLLGDEGVLSGASAVVQMPTSAGKTKSTEIIIRSAFLSGRASVAVVIAPFRALCREISDSFKKAFEGEDIVVNELLDVLDISEADEAIIQFLSENFDLNAGATSSIIISTPEKLVYLLRHEPQLIQRIGLLVFDEGHQFDTGRRGVTYELLMASLKADLQEDVQKVLISAVMSNADSIGEWLNGESGVDIQGSKCLPTIRSIAFASWKTALGQLHYIDLDNEAGRNYFVPRVIEQINLGTRGQETNPRLFPEKNNSSSIAAYLGVKLCHQGPVAIFCGSKSTVTTICELVVDYYSRGLELTPPSEVSVQDELNKIAYLSSLHFGQNYIYTRAIRLGILPHSANVPNGVRVSVEWAMESNSAALVVCTSTLAQGVNLPIKYLIVTSTFQAGQEITTRDFHNLIGRAGRAGYHTEGSIVFTDTEIYDKRTDFSKRWKWRRALHLLDFTNAEDCVSSLLDLIKPFEFHAIETDVAEFITDPDGYRDTCIDLSSQEEIDIDTLLDQMGYKKNLIDSIESYFLSYLKDNPDAEASFFVDLVQETLAYFLADDSEKAALEMAFSLIAHKVLQLPKEKYSYYGKALLGVDQLLKIEEWISEHKDNLDACEYAEETLDACWSLLISLISHKALLKIKPHNVHLPFAQKWIDGASYLELFDSLRESGARYHAKSQRRKIKMDHTIDLADGALAFDSMLFVGAIADVAESKDVSEPAILALRSLQTRLRLGLRSDLELWLYTRGYVDREVCKRLAVALGEEGVPDEGFDFNILDQHRDALGICLSEFPTYFSV